MKRKPAYYSFGLETILAGEELEKFTDITACAKEAIAKGYSFIMGYYQNGNQVVLALDDNVRVVSKAEALKEYACDGDKRTLLNSNKANIWIITPTVGFSDILIPFSGRIRSFEKVRPESIL